MSEQNRDYLAWLFNEDRDMMNESEDEMETRGNTDHPLKNAGHGRAVEQQIP